MKQIECEPLTAMFKITMYVVKMMVPGAGVVEEIFDIGKTLSIKYAYIFTKRKRSIHRILHNYENNFLPIPESKFSNCNQFYRTDVRQTPFEPNFFHIFRNTKWTLEYIRSIIWLKKRMEENFIFYRRRFEFCLNFY